MQQSGVRRLVVTSLIGQGNSAANAAFYDRLLLATVLCGADKYEATMGSEVESSGLGWVILRPAILSDDPANGNVRVFDTSTGETAHKMTRSDLAAFMMVQLPSREHRHQPVTIANS